MTTITIIYGKRVPIDLRNDVCRAIDGLWNWFDSENAEQTYTLRQPWQPDNFYEAFDRIAREHGCGVVFNEKHARYVFERREVPACFLALTGALHPLRADGKGAVA